MLNFKNYDDERYELVYVQTKRGVFNLLDRMKSLSNSCGKNMVINVVSKEYWPLPWYLREYKNAKFWGNVIDNPNAPVILVDKSGESKLKGKIKGKIQEGAVCITAGCMARGLYTRRSVQCRMWRRSNFKSSDSANYQSF